jgi:hypothetical protein
MLQKLEFVILIVAKFDIKIVVGSNPIEFKLNYTANFVWIAT